MIARKENETLYQNNNVELSDEVLAGVIGGCGDSNGCDQSYQQNNDWGQCQQNGGWGSGSGNGYGRGGRGRRCEGLLGDLLGDLL